MVTGEELPPVEHKNVIEKLNTICYMVISEEVPPVEHKNVIEKLNTKFVIW
jgi:hypothetical protein